MSKVILKKSSVIGKAPNTSDLDYGELALNYADSKLYFKKSDGTTIDYFSTQSANLDAETLLGSLTTVDGSGSGLDADLLDGYHASVSDAANTVVVRDADDLINITGINLTTNDVDQPLVVANWNITDATWNFQLKNGVTLQAGQELHFYGRAVGAIPNGSVVMFAGTQGGGILLTLADATAPGFHPSWIVGVATQDLANNAWGYVTWFGKVRDVNTYGHALGAILYLDPTSPGGHTDVAPIAPNPKIRVSAVVRVSTSPTANNGILIVRPSFADKLSDLQDVYVNSIADNDILQWNAASQRWENISQNALLDWSNIQNKPDPTITVTLSGDVSGTANTTLTDLSNGTISISTTIAANSVALGTDTTGNYVATVSTSAPLSGGAAGSEGAAISLSLASGYGDTQNPYAAKTAKYFLAAPSGTDGAPTFREIVAADIPTLNQSTTGSAATLTNARTLTIGSTGKTFDGSTNVSWSLSEIGAQAAGNYQPLDADLTAISGLAGTSGFLKKTAADTWTLDTSSYLTSNQSINITGDASGSGATSISLTLANSGVTAGTYAKVTVDSKGRVTSGTTLVASDIPSIDASKITSGTIDAARLPSYVDDVIEANTLSGFPATGESGKIYVALDTNKTYRWSGSAYVYITSGAVDSVGGYTGIVTAANLLAAIKTVDGASSGLDADTLDGKNSTDFYLATNPSGYTTNTGTVTSISATAGTGISITGSPITTSGTLTITNTAPNTITDITITHNASNVLVNSSDGADGTIDAATTSLAGVMSASDKTKLDGIATGATANTGTVTSVSGTGSYGGLSLTGTVTTSGSLTFGGTPTGTWPISVSGNAATATGLSDNTNWMLNRGSVAEASIDSATSNGFYTISRTGHSTSVLTWNAGGSTGPVQLDFHYGGGFSFRSKTDSATWNAWKTVLTSLNYNSYSPTLTGDNASGTWNISITGSSSYATSAGALQHSYDRTDSSDYPVGWFVSGNPSQVYSCSAVTIQSSTGTLSATNLNTTSDRNKKENINTIADPIAKVLQLRGVTFNWIDSKLPSLGLIAQEVEAVIPEIVATHTDGHKTVSYGNLVGLLIEAIKEQQSQIIALQQAVQSIKPSL